MYTSKPLKIILLLILTANCLVTNAQSIEEKLSGNWKCTFYYQWEYNDNDGFEIRFKDVGKFEYINNKGEVSKGSWKVVGKKMFIVMDDGSDLGFVKVKSINENELVTIQYSESKKQKFEVIYKRVNNK